jgi:predicted transcriptional regulator
MDRPVVRVTINYECPECGKSMVMLCRHARRGSDAIMCQSRGCSLLDRVMIVPVTTIRGEWI